MQHDDILKLLRERIVAFAASRFMGEMAEDLAQDVLMVLHEKYRHVSELTDLVPLAFRILRYKMSEAGRKAMRRGEYNLVPIEDVLVADPAEDQTGELLRRERLDRLIAALDQLTPRCRQVFRWKLEGKKFEEIRALLGVDSINTVYTWDFRCRKQLLDLLGGRWD
jgi:RNA polymerase sigma-70 factor (ECF subfamily)